MKHLLLLEDFRKLIRGQIVEAGECQIALADIGYDVMSIELTQALMEYEHVSDVRSHDADG